MLYSVVATKMSSFNSASDDWYLSLCRPKEVPSSPSNSHASNEVSISTMYLLTWFILRSSVVVMFCFYQNFEFTECCLTLFLNIIYCKLFAGSALALITVKHGRRMVRTTILTSQCLCFQG